MIKIKSFLQNIDNLIEPYKKWIMFLLVNLYYPFLNWFYGSIIPGYGPEANMGSSGPPNTQEIILIITIFSVLIILIICRSLFRRFSPRHQSCSSLHSFFLVKNRQENPSAIILK